jgi:cell wall-associated NlpC family hydrolase
MDFRQRIVNEAREWVGTPYRHFSSVKGSGADCGLFIMKVYENVGLINYVQPAFYPVDWAFHNPTGEMFEQIVKGYCIEISKGEEGLGDIILYKFGKVLSHAAIIVENDMIIHSEKPVGVKLSNRWTCDWSDRERKYYTWQEMEPVKQ